MARKLPKVALIYDFDGTLSPGNMQEFGFIQAVGKTPEEFWRLSNEVAPGQDASHILCYMKLMIDEAKASGIELKRDNFVNFGKEIELFDGVREWFSMINEYGRRKGVEVEHYINSSGLLEIIEGCPIASEFKRIFACSFMYDENGIAVWPAVAVDYTGKTQFLFKIAKGIMSVSDTVMVNESQSEESKPVPFEHMIYMGDGETDVPCMKIVKMFGGTSIAVFPAGSERKRLTADKLYRQERVNFKCRADYTRGGEIWSVVTAQIDKIKADSELARLRRRFNR